MNTLIKKSMAAIAGLALVLSYIIVPGGNTASAAANWDVSGTFVVQMEYEGTDYPHTLTLTQDEEGNLSGGGTSGAYEWEVTSGAVIGNMFQIDAEYTATDDAEGTILTLDGTIAEDGSISGIWEDNYQGGERSGGFDTLAGVAEEIEETEPSESATVTIVKYVDGEVATAEGTENASFGMNATWDAENTGAGSGSFSLSPTGFNNDTPYYATTAEMSSGASYSVSEAMNAQTGESCDVEGVEYGLEGYSVGDSLALAEAAEVTDEAALTDITSDKYIIVWNDDCSTPEDPETVQVTIVKYVDGEMATEESAGGDSFAMNATWDAENIGAGSGTYTLADDNDVAYTAETVELSEGADYSTSEVMNAQTGESCDVEGVEYGLVGYHVGDSIEDAEDSSMVDEVSFTNLQEDKYVIVLNDLCSTEDNNGTIGGEVVDEEVELEVTSVEVLDGSAVANNTYEDGWKFRFNITVPTDENGIAMKFSNWDIDGAATDSIAAANNMRISSAQADNGGATITVTAADTYTIPDLNITGDLDAEEDGLQIQVIVDVKIPAGTENGSYTTSYGVRSQ